MRLFRWACPNCRTLLAVETEEGVDNEKLGVDSTGCFGYGPRCPMCETKMVDEDEVASWFIRKRTLKAGDAFTLSGDDFDEWRAEHHSVQALLQWLVDREAKR